MIDELSLCDLQNKLPGLLKGKPCNSCAFPSRFRQLEIHLVFLSNVAVIYLKCNIMCTAWKAQMSLIGGKCS